MLGKLKAEIKRGFAKILVSQFGALFSSKTALLIVFITVFFLSLIAGWIPDGLNCLFFDDGCNKLKGLIMLVVAVLVLFTLLFIGYMVVSPYRYAVVSTFPGKKRALILFLSNVNFRTEKEELMGKFRDLTNTLSRFGTEKEEFRKKLSGSISYLHDLLNTLSKFDSLKSKEQELQGKLNELIDTLSKVNALEGRLEVLNQTVFKNWRMPIEAVAYHLPVLEKMVVITSKESSPQLPLFLKLLKFVIPEASRVRVNEIKVNDFENFEEIQEAIEKSYGELQKEGYKRKEIILDVTGGKKIVSIVGAILSLNPGREFQYVSTTNYKVKSYDVEVVKDD